MNIPEKLLHDYILPQIARTAIFVCKDWYKIHFPNLLKDDRVKPTKNSITWAAKNNHVRVVEILIPYFAPQNPEILIKTLNSAASRYRTQVINFLIATPWAAEHSSEIFCDAINNNNTYLFKLAIQHLDPEVSFQYACRSGNKKIVKLLLADPRVDPTLWDNEAIKIAAKCGQTKIVKLCLKDSRINDKLTARQIDKLWTMAVKQINIVNL